MKKFALFLVLFLVWSWPMELGAGTESQDSNAGKTPAASSKNPEKQKQTGKEAAVQQHGKKKKAAKKDEDCGCDTTLFGEPVTPQVPKPAQGKKGSTEGKQTVKSKGKNVDDSKTVTKSDLKEGAIQKSEKHSGASGDASQSKNPTVQPGAK